MWKYNCWKDFISAGMHIMNMFNASTFKLSTTHLDTYIQHLDHRSSYRVLQRNFARFRSIYWRNADSSRYINPVSRIRVTSSSAAYEHTCSTLTPSSPPLHLPFTNNLPPPPSSPPLCPSAEWSNHRMEKSWWSKRARQKGHRESP